MFFSTPSLVHHYLRLLSRHLFACRLPSLDKYRRQEASFIYTQREREKDLPCNITSAKCIDPELFAYREVWPWWGTPFFFFALNLPLFIRYRISRLLYTDTQCAMQLFSLSLVYFFLLLLYFLASSVYSLPGCKKTKKKKKKQGIACAHHLIDINQHLASARALLPLFFACAMV